MVQHPEDPDDLPKCVNRRLVRLKAQRMILCYRKEIEGPWLSHKGPDRKLITVLFA